MALRGAHVWDELVGQEAAVEILRGAALGARGLVDGEHAHASVDPSQADRTSADPSDYDIDSAGDDISRAMSHAWLITGPPGSGRSVAARAFAAALQCTEADMGAGHCPGCITTMSGSNADVHLVATEASVISVDTARSLVLQAQSAPSQGRWRVIIVEDADRLTEAGANALLKAIEEPPARTVWLLCAPSPEDMITTIRSRCRHLGLRIPSVEAVADLLVSEGVADRQTAISAARTAQSHIGLARALAKDPEMRERRRQIMTAPVRVRSVGEAVFAAEGLLKTAQAQADAQTLERNAREKAALLRQLGMDESERPDRQQRVMLKQLEDDQKRRSKRALTDALDRALVDLLAIYRDVLMVQLGTGQQLVNGDLEDVVHELASDSTPRQTMGRVAAIEEARKRLMSNGQALLVLEAMAVSLRPQA